MKPALVLFAHGSRDPEWAEPFRGVCQRLALARSDLAVELAFLELMQPRLGEAVDRLVAAGSKRITIAPLFMAQGAHMKRDVSAILADLRARHADVELTLLSPVGEAAPVVDAMSAWIAAKV